MSEGKPQFVNIAGGGKIVDVNAMPSALRTSYFNTLAKGDALAEAKQLDAAKKAWAEADDIAGPYTREAKLKPPPPTAPVPAPPELIPDEGKALAVCLSPDVCRSPKATVPYMSWGKGDDKFNYSPNVQANGKVIKRHDSKFSCCYGDEPGVGKGVKSGTVGDVVEPVTSSPIVRANGIPIQRHTDRCTLNNGNCPGEYVYVQSTQTYKAPDGRDSEDKTLLGGAKEQAGHFWSGMKATSDEASFVNDAVDKIGKWYSGEASPLEDAKGLYNSLPTGAELWNGTKNVGRGVVAVGGKVINDPLGSAQATTDYVVGSVKEAIDSVEKGYDKHGISGALGAGTGVLAGAISPGKKLKMLKEAGEGLEEAGDIGKVAREAEQRLKEAEEAARRAREGKQTIEGERLAEQDSKDGARISRNIPLKEVECFSKPPNVNKEEFLRQLKEQEDALNSTTADTLLARRQAIRDAGGTTPLRDLKAQASARIKYEADRFDALRSSGKTRAEARSIIETELSKLAATHRLDIIAGGNPSDISGMGDRSVNSSMGSQWKGRRSQSMENYAKELQENGAGTEKMRVRLRMC